MLSQGHIRCQVTGPRRAPAVPHGSPNHLYSRPRTNFRANVSHRAVSVDTLTLSFAAEAFFALPSLPFQRAQGTRAAVSGCSDSDPEIRWSLGTNGDRTNTATWDCAKRISLSPTPRHCQRARRKLSSVVLTVSGYLTYMKCVRTVLSIHGLNCRTSV